MQNLFSASLSKLTLLAILVHLLIITVDAAPVFKKEKKQNIIFMVSDGMGPAYVGLARQYNQLVNNVELPSTLFLDDYLVGTLRTRSNDSYITDSAAAGTALATGFKTYNGAIGVDADGIPVASIGEALKLEGYKVGIVVTCSIVDATPAVWGAHALDRGSDSLIAEQLLGINHPLGRIPDLLIGGGRESFQTNVTNPNAVREDGRDLLQEVTTNKTWTYSGDRESFDALDKGKNVTLPLLALYADGDYPYVIDNSDATPSLVEQVEVAINALAEATKDSDKGFFLMIEGSRIDHAGHANDSPALVHETLAYDDVYRFVVNWVDESEVDTVIVSTSDHETGALTLNGKEASDFGPLINATHSDDEAKFEEFLKSEILENGLGIYNYTEEEVSRIKDVKADENAKAPDYLIHITNLTNSRAKVHFANLDHSAVDVNVYAHANNERLSYKVKDAYTGFTGNHENVDYVPFIESITNINLADLTEKIKNIQLE